MIKTIGKFAINIQKTRTVEKDGNSPYYPPPHTW